MLKEEENHNLLIKNNGFIYKNIININSICILDFYSKYYPHSSKEEWKLKIQNGQVYVNGKLLLNENYILKKGEILEYHRYNFKMQ